jgi:hypothetical protein
MKSKDKFEVLFICLLILIGGGLVYIFFADLDDDFFPNIVKNLHSNSDYQIIDKIEECSDGYEEIYRDTDNIYYFECNKINFIYLEWEDGTITSMKEELNSGNVSIDSLLEHGLKCEKKSIIEENTTIEVEDAQENKTDEN